MSFDVLSARAGVQVQVRAAPRERQSDRSYLDDRGQKVMDVFKERKEQQENELKAKLAKLRGPKTNLPDIPGDAKSVVPYAPEKAVRHPRKT